MELVKIKSFEADHTKILPGMYLSRTDGDIDTYDLRFFKPNSGVVFTTAAAHTLEHLLATFLRSSAESGNVIYVEIGRASCRERV